MIGMTQKDAKEQSPWHDVLQQGTGRHNSTACNRAAASSNAGLWPAQCKGRDKRVKGKGNMKGNGNMKGKGSIRGKYST